MDTIENVAFQTYQSNLLYFEKNHSELYKRIITLEASISQGIYKEHYALEYKEEGYFDVQELSTGYLLYGENSNKYTEKLLLTIDKKRSGAIFEAQQRFLIKEEELEEIGDFKNFHSSLWATAKLIHYNAKIAPKDNSEMKKLYKYIFFGGGLGLHVKDIIETHDIKVAFVHDHDLELFRLSLFVTDYSKIAKNCICYFSIMQNYSDTQTAFFNFLNEAFNYNLYIKFTPFRDSYEEDLKNFQSITLSQNCIAYPYQAFMARSLGTIQKITQNYCFLDISKTYCDTPLSTKPILVLASGPSLQHNTEWIKNNQENFFIVAVLSACRHLSYHNIRVDLVIHIDPQAHSTLLLDNLNLSYFDSAMFILGSNVHQDLVNKLKKEKLFFIEESTSFKANHGFFALPSIGEYATILPLILGAKTVYIIGLDLALDPTTMKDHIDLHIAHQTLTTDNNEESIQFQKSICYVEGNFIQSIPTTPSFRLSITQFAKALAYYKQTDQTVYNLSNGAFLEGTIPLKIETMSKDVLQTICCLSLKKEFDDFLHQNSSCECRSIDRKNIQIQLEKAKYILDRCNDMRHIASKEVNNYLYKKLIPFMQEICEIDKEHKSDIAEIFFEYFKISLSFLFDTFNTSNLKNEKNHIKAIDKIVLDEMTKIASTYIDTIEKNLTKE